MFKFSIASIIAATDFGIASGLSLSAERIDDTTKEQLNPAYDASEPLLDVTAGKQAQNSKDTKHKHKIQNTNYKTQNTNHKSQNTNYKTQNTAQHNTTQCNGM